MARERCTWCLLYVEAANEHTALDEVRAFLGLADDDGTFRLPVADLEVRRALQWPGHPDDFMGWRALVEIDINAEATEEAAIAFIAGLMEMFRSYGHRVVAELETHVDGLPQKDFDEICARGWPRLEPIPTEPDATGPAATGPVATGPVATGPGATEPAATGPVVIERKKKRWRR